MPEDLRVRIDPGGPMGGGVAALLGGVPGITCSPGPADVRVRLGWPLAAIRQSAVGVDQDVAPRHMLVLVHGLDPEAAVAAVNGVVAFCHGAAGTDELVAGIRHAARGSVFYSAALQAELDSAMEVAHRAGCEDPHRFVGDLTPAEWPVALLASCFMDWEEIATILQRGVETVRTHRQHIYEKLDVHNRQTLRELYWAALWPHPRPGRPRRSQAGH